MKWTIRKKFLLGYFVLFTLTALLVHQIMKDSLDENSEAVIKNELTKLQHTTREHIKQFALIHPAREDLFREYGSTIAQELSKLHKQSVALFDQEGHFLYEAVPFDQPLILENQVYQTDYRDAENTELQAAFKNQASFTRHPVTNGNLVYFAYPLYINGQFYGVLRFTGDYTNVFRANQKVLHSFTILVISLFLGVFIISTLFTTQIIKPLLRLTKATKQVAAGNYKMDVHVKTKDELEELAKSFNEMQQNIQQHVDMIEREKDKVILLEKSRTSFFNNVTHELKTPLATISGYAQIIGEPDFNDPVFQRKATRKIQLESERLNRMVIELIELSKSETDIVSKKLEPISILPLLSSICEDMSLKAQRRQMTIEVKGDNGVVLGNQDEIRQVFINVLDNAIKYGMTEEPIAVISSGEVITVTNASEPIPNQIVRHAFEPFIHTKGTGSSGLGLTICKQIITKHNGTITFDYKEGRAILSIVLPHLAINRQ